MSAITIQISEERYRKLQAIAEQAKSTPERVLQANVEDWLDHSQEEFAQAAKYVVSKNAELYRRLA